MRPIAAPKNLERTIAARSTTQAKYWNNPTGWLNTIKHLKEKGYRVINYHVCNGCWNDGAISFVHDDFDWCPRHKHTDCQYECTRFITAEKVCNVIDKLMTDHGFNPKR